MQLASSFDENGMDKDGWHHIHLAALGGNLKQLTTLLDKNSEWVDLETKDDPLHLMTALLISAQEGDTTAVELLLDRKANIDKQCDNGWTALMTATYWGKRKCVRLLIERKANRAHTAVSGIRKGMTALEMARAYGRWGNEEIIAMLEAQPAPEAPPAPFPTYTGNGKVPAHEATS